MKTKIAIIKTFILIIVTCLVMAFVCLINSSVEYIFVERKIQEFVDRGEFYIEIGSTKYYKVSKTYEYEDVSRNVFNPFDSKKYVGSTGDILSTTRNPLRSIPVVGLISRLAWAGHSALITEDDGSKICEVVGNEDDPEDNFVRIVENEWISKDSGSPHIIGLRVKDLTDEDRKTVTSYANTQALEKDKYNFLFPLTRSNKYYCTDLVSRSFNEVDINLNNDGFMTSGNDMILSKKTYIIFFRKRVGNKFIVYYLTE